jgi:8-oxo-dGTP pyrophosphatase MutT (NUDIX family)/phosphohistidine phosphatase SixA
VRAAGGLVFRGAGDDVVVLLVHRPRYDDWTIPKGKAEAGEADEDCALREVEEEAGLRCELLWELPSTHYVDSRGRSKLVRYWAMRPLGEASARAEVDEVRWLRPVEALALLSWERDHAVVRAFGHGGGEPLLLVRHAQAGDRESWRGDDRLRPLDARGRMQAAGLVQVLSGHRLARILSSPHARCVQTVQSLAAARGLAVETRPELAEGSGGAAVVAAAAETGAGVVCLHRAELEELVGRQPPKGATVLVELRDGGVVEVAELPPPH